MSYVVDRGILRLRDQLDAAAPGRKRGSDGTVGDFSHAARASDHNPESPAPAGNPADQVDAGDFTHDPAGGADMAVVTEAIRRSKDARIKYCIFDRRIFSSYAANGRRAWEWGPYDGSNPHTGHAHVSVNDIHHDETRDWQIGIDMTDSPGAVTAQWRLLAALLLDPAMAARKEIPTGARLTSVPLIELLERVDRNVADTLSRVAVEPGPTEIVLSGEQLAVLISEVVHQVSDLVVARLGALRFEVQE